MAANNIKGLKVEIGGDTTELGKALENVNSKSKDLSSELGQINKLLKMDPGNADLIAQKQKVLAEAVENTGDKLRTLKEAEKQVQAQFERGEVSAEQYRALQREVIATERKLGSYESAARETADGVEDLGNAAQDAESKTGGLGSTLANVAKVGLQAVTAAVGAAISGLVAAAESTREYRTEMGKLDTAFQSAGHSSEAAYSTYSALQGVLGDSGQATEAANHLAKLASSEEDLAAWTDIATGVYATFGDSLPIEGLTEAANETAKTGALTGGLADALNWAGVSEDAFQAQLDACSSEQERQALITETLNGLYSEAADKYRETNAEVIRANEANEAWTASLAGVGGAVEPVMSSVKLLGASLLSDLVPGVTDLSGAIQALLDGAPGAAEQVGAALSGLITNVLNMVTELAPTIVEVGASLITTLVTTLITMLPQLTEVGIQLLTTILDALTQSIPSLTAAITEMIPQLATALVNGLPQILDAAIQLFMALVQAVPQITIELAKVMPDIIAGLVNGLLAGIGSLGEAALELGRSLLDSIKSFFGIHSPSTVTQGVGQNIVQGMVNGLKNMPAQVAATISGAVQRVATWGTNLLSRAKTAATNMLNGVTNTLRGIPGKVSSAISGAVQNVATWGSNMMSRAKTGMTNVVNAVTNTLKGLPSKVLSIGGDLVTGLWNGITNKFSWLTSKISGFASGVMDSIKSFFGIHSPSTETAWVGDMLDQGLAKGILDNAKNPVKAMQKVSAGVLDATGTVDGLSLERSLQTSSVAAAAQAASGGGIAAKLDKILAAIEKGQVLMLDGDALVGGTVDRYDTVMGQRRLLAARGAV